MTGFQIDHSDRDEAASTCRAILVLSLIGAILPIAAYLMWGVN